MTQKYIIGIVGLKGSGKSTVGKMLAEHLGSAYGEQAFADPLKRFVKEVFGWSDEALWGESALRDVQDHRYPIPTTSPFYVKGEAEFLTPRIALQSLGTDWG